MSKSLQKFNGEKTNDPDSCEDMKEEIWRDYNKDAALDHVAHVNHKLEWREKEEQEKWSENPKSEDVDEI